MDLEKFLTSYANEALLVSFVAAHARANSAETRTFLAHVLDQLLDEDSIRGKVPESVRNRARASLAEQIRGLVADPAEKGVLAFKLGALVTPALEAMRSLSAVHITPHLFLSTCLSNATVMDPSSVSSLEALRIAGITAEMLLPGATDRARRHDFTFRHPDLGTDGLGTDMTAMARAGFWPDCPLVGMEEQLEKLVIILNAMQSSAAIIGEPGVGKSALLAGLAWHITRRTRPLIPPDMDSWTLVRIEASDMLKGTSGRGELESRVNDMLAFFSHNPTVIPFFEEVHKLLDTDDTASRSVATAFKVPMAEGRFRCLGATTDREYARFIASDDAMNSRFRKILVHEPSEDVACQIVGNSRANLLRGKASQLGVQLDDDAIRAAVKVTSVYQKADRLPRKALNLLSETVSELVYRLSRTDTGDVAEAVSPVISGENVRRYFSKVSGIPVNDLDDDPASFYSHLESELNARVRGQEAAVAAVTGHLGLYASGFVDQRRPRGRFLFVGPPGVGKTELALTLAEKVMHESGSLVVINMADYTKEDALNRFMGASPGYVGFGQTPTVYSKVMMRPYSVVVLDEFEKASGELANPLISVLDGKSEDSQGRMVDFSQCIFVMTSNAIVQRDVAAATVYGKLRSGDPRWLAAPVLAGLGLDSSTSFEDVREVVGRLSDAAVSGLLHDLGGVDEEGIRMALVSLGGVWTQPLVDRLDRIVLFNPLSSDALHCILGQLVDARRELSSRRLPADIDTPEARNDIIAWATQGGGSSSARRLERSLLRWLSDAATRQLRRDAPETA